jgi:hypothetical protein
VIDTVETRVQLLDAQQAAAALNISERTLWDLEAPRGPIPLVRIGRRKMFDVRDLQAFVDSRKTPAVGGRN